LLRVGEGVAGVGEGTTETTTKGTEGATRTTTTTEVATTEGYIIISNNIDDHIR
jgi:hypothetical protein